MGELDITKVTQTLCAMNSQREGDHEESNLGHERGPCDERLSSPKIDSPARSLDPIANCSCELQVPPIASIPMECVRTSLMPHRSEPQQLDSWPLRYGMLTVIAFEGGLSTPEASTLFTT